MAGIQQITMISRRTASGRKRPVDEMAGVGFGVVLRAEPRQGMQRYYCIMGVWLVVTSVDCVLIWPGEVALAGEFTSGLGKGRGVGLLAR